MRLFLVLSLSVLLVASTAHAAKTLPFPPTPPDLSFSAYGITSPAVVHCGTQTIIFNVTETNTGSTQTGPYTTYHFSNGVAFCAKQRPGLAPLSSATFTDVCTLWNGPCDCSPGTYTIPFFGFVDSLGVVNESNEGNNISPTVVQPAACP